MPQEPRRVAALLLAGLLATPLLAGCLGGDEGGDAFTVPLPREGDRLRLLLAAPAPRGEGEFTFEGLRTADTGRAAPGPALVIRAPLLGAPTVQGEARLTVDPFTRDAYALNESGRDNATGIPLWTTRFVGATTAGFEAFTPFFGLYLSGATWPAHEPRTLLIHGLPATVRYEGRDAEGAARFTLDLPYETRDPDGVQVKSLRLELFYRDGTPHPFQVRHAGGAILAQLLAYTPGAGPVIDLPAPGPSPHPRPATTATAAPLDGSCTDGPRFRLSAAMKTALESVALRAWVAAGNRDPYLLAARHQRDTTGNATTTPVDAWVLTFGSTATHRGLTLILHGSRLGGNPVNGVTASQTFDHPHLPAAILVPTTQITVCEAWARATARLGHAPDGLSWELSRALRPQEEAPGDLTDALKSTWSLLEPAPGPGAPVGSRYYAMSATNGEPLADARTARNVQSL